MSEVYTIRCKSFVDCPGCYASIPVKEKDTEVTCNVCGKKVDVNREGFENGKA